MRSPAVWLAMLLLSCTEYDLGEQDGPVEGGPVPEVAVEPGAISVASCGEEVTASVAVRNAGDNQVQRAAILGHHLAFHVIEVALGNHRLQAALRISFLVGRAHEIHDRASDDFITSESELGQPVIGNRDQQTVAIDRVQHCGR